MNDNSAKIVTKKKIPFIYSIFPEELFGFIMLTLFLIIFLIYKKVPNLNRITARHYFYFFSYTMIIAFIMGIKIKGLVKILRNFFPLILVYTVFENLGDIVQILNPHLSDWSLIKIDKFLFGGDPSLWMQKFYSPWLSRIMHSCYTSYYFIPPLVGMVIYLKGNYKGFRDFLVAVVFCAFIGYIGYLLVPAVGPRYTLAHLYTKDLKTGVFLTKVMNVIDNLEPFKADCFPSLHTAHTVIGLLFSFKYSKFLFYFLAPLVTGLVISTMYGRYHYGIDVIAGLLLAWLCIYIAPKINNFWYEKILPMPIENYFPQKIQLKKLKCFRLLTKKI